MSQHTINVSTCLDLMHNIVKMTIKKHGLARVEPTRTRTLSTNYNSSLIVYRAFEWIYVNIYSQYLFIRAVKTQPSMSTLFPCSDICH